MIKVWTFKIVGGEPIKIAIPQNPILDHKGEVTLWKMVGPPEWAEAIEKMLTVYGAQVERFTETRETDEERSLRMRSED